MARSVVGILHTRPEAQALVTNLKSGGFADSEISALLPDKEGTKDFAHDNATKAPEGAVTGAASGGAVGGAIGLAAGLGALAIPGVGPLIAAGPIMAALSGAAVGATVGGIGGALIGMGVPEYEAKIYEGKIKDGNILIAVDCLDGDSVKRCEEIFKQSGATDVHCVHEAGAKNK